MNFPPVARWSRKRMQDDGQEDIATGDGDVDEKKEGQQQGECQATE